MPEFLLGNAAIGVFLIALFTSLIIAAIYKLTTDQHKAAGMKKELSELKKKINEAQKANNQKDMNKYQKRMLELSHEQMQMSMKPMMVTLVVALPIFLWMLPSLYGLVPIHLEDGKGTLVYQETRIPLVLEENSEPTLTLGSVPIQGQIFGNEIKFSADEVAEIDGLRLQPTVYNREKNELHAKLVVVTLPFALPFFGQHFGWLGWYILCSLPLGILTRKLMGVQ